MMATKILIDARVIGGEAQGSSTYLKGLYNSVYNHYKTEYELFFAGYHYESMKEAFPFLQKNKFIQLKSTSKFRLFGFEFPDIIKRNRIDFAHFQYMTPFIKNCKFIVTTHDVLFNDFKQDFPKWYAFKRNFLFKTSLQKSDIRLTVSEYSKKQIALHYNLPEDSLHITPNAVKKEFFQPFSINETQNNIFKRYNVKNYLLYVSRIETRKNHQLLMDAFRSLNLAQKGYQLVFIGNDTLDSKKEVSKIHQMKTDFPSHFHWFSNVNDKTLLDFYRGAKLFVYPSKAEGFGIPPIEAVAAGVNTICSNVTAMKDFDFFEDNYFSPENLEELKLKIQQNLEYSNRQWEAYYMKELIKKRYSWEVSSNLLNHLIQKEIKKEALNFSSLNLNNTLKAVA
ncbi:glycosyltransferase family 4 protein [Saprospiraceae bacterium]|jgi:glycosyltransferase involved in cell wall biosynthesis|nr:glycosyltransferase family 4 protein [Bacteroidota bacterium]MDB4727958.1 glycosyltransferase family 4 protein [Saprospiraceae bacterium]